MPTDEQLAEAKAELAEAVAYQERPEHVDPTEPGTLRAVIEQWYSDLNVRLFEAGFNPAVLGRKPGRPDPTQPEGTISLLVPDHPNVEVRAILGAVQLLAPLSSRARRRIAAYLTDYCAEVVGPDHDEDPF